MAAPKYRDGSLLLKNGSSWYKVSARVIEGEAYVQPGQVAEGNIPAVPTWAQSVVMKASNGAYYSVFLESYEGQIFTGRVLLASPAVSYRVFLRGDDGERYELVLHQLESDGEVYLGLQLVDNDTADDTCTPWKLVSAGAIVNGRGLTPGALIAARTLTAAGSNCEREILTGD